MVPCVIGTLKTISQSIHLRDQNDKILKELLPSHYMAVILSRGHKTLSNKTINPKTLHDKFSSNLSLFFSLTLGPIQNSLF